MQIKFEQVSYTYQQGTPLEHQGLNNVNFEIKSGDFTALVGHTGSGKSTILQHLNALKLPTSGKITVGEYVLTADSKSDDFQSLRQKVGMVFQFPESQLFAETVADDIAFGPQNFGVPKEEALEIAAEMIEVVGLPSHILDQSPFELSGGQMRRVAIAGVLAMKPEVLVLDEPTAGLDPKGRKEMLELFYHLHREKHLTTILVTHQMDDVAQYADYVVALDAGTVAWTGEPREFFSQKELLERLQLDYPSATLFAEKLVQHPFWHKKMSMYPVPLTTKELAQIIVQIKTNEGDYDE